MICRVFAPLCRAGSRNGFSGTSPSPAVLGTSASPLPCLTSPPTRRARRWRGRMRALARDLEHDAGGVPRLVSQLADEAREAAGPEAERRKGAALPLGVHGEWAGLRGGRAGARAHERSGAQRPSRARGGGAHALGREPLARGRGAGRTGARAGGVLDAVPRLLPVLPGAAAGVGAAARADRAAARGEGGPPSVPIRSPTYGVRTATRPTTRIQRTTPLASRTNSIDWSRCGPSVTTTRSGP